MPGRHLYPPGLSPIVFIYLTWRIIVPAAIGPIPSVSYILYNLLSPMPYMYFSSSLYILFSLGFYSVLYRRGLYSGCSIPMLYI